MSEWESRVIGRRTLLGGAAVAALAVGLASVRTASAEPTSTWLGEEAVDAAASRLDGDLIELRRDIHRHPEVAGQERRTAELVAGRLRAAGLEVRTGVGGYGVVGVLSGARPGRTVAYRADMDAVPPDQQRGDGAVLAHVCGHDLHTSIGVGVAEVLSSLRERLTGTVVFVFQPAEETLAGAAAMLGDRVFAGTWPVEIHAVHCGPFPVGQFAVTPGFGLPGQDHDLVTVTGADANERAQRLAAEINALGTVSPPSSSADLERLVAEVEVPDGPLARFVFMTATATDSAEVRVSYRCWPEQRYVQVRQDIRRLARAAGTTATFATDPFPAMRCPERDGQVVRHYLRHTLGRDRVRTLYAAVPFSGEDFALFLNRLPGTYTFLGVRSPGADIETSYPHFTSFTPDERAIGHGVRAMAGWLAGRSRPVVVEH